MEKLTIDNLISYLETAEGSSIHRNKTEKDVTAFYGVYREANKKSRGWIWLDYIAKLNNLEDYRTNKESRKK